MKRMFVTALIMLLCLNTITAKAEDKKTLKARVENMSVEQKEARLVQMKLRVEEIKNLDRSSMSKEEKKDLRKELKDLNQEAKAMGSGGIYLSTAAVIIIILLLILLL
jgi:Flp pilus assembly protein TadB